MKLLSDLPGERSLKSLPKVWLYLGLGLPLTSLLLLLTQPNLQTQFALLQTRIFNSLDAPYRYPFFDAAWRPSPLPQIQQEIAFYQTRVRQNPQDGLDLAFLAIAYLQMARATGESNWYLLAEQTAQQSLVNLPFDNPDAVIALARIAEAQHDFQAALQLATQLPTDRGDAIAIQVTANLAIGELQPAKQAAETLVNQLPSVSSLTLLAIVQAAQGQKQAALQSFQHALAAEEPGEISSSARTRTLLGRFYYEQGKVELARSLYQEALRILPGYSQALLNLAQLEIRVGRYAAADRYYDQLEATSRGTARTFDPLVLRGKARLQFLQGNHRQANEFWQQAEGLLRQTLTSNPLETDQNRSAFGHRRDLARLLLERGRSPDISEALALMQAEIQVRRDAETLETLAWALSRAHRWQDAQQVIQEAIALGTRDAALFDRARSIEQALGNDAQAEIYFQQVQAIDPSFNDAARQASGLGAGLGS